MHTIVTNIYDNSHIPAVQILFIKLHKYIYIYIYVHISIKRVCEKVAI